MTRLRLSVGQELGLLRELGFEDAYPPRPTEGVRESGEGRPERLRAATEGVREGGEGRSERLRPATEGVREGAEDRSERLRAVAAEAGGCTACRLCEQRNTVVFGAGDADADLMFVGEGPGYNEDRQGLPFVGPAGQLLNRIIQAIDLRREDVYITNVVKCRPPNNRDPQPDETAACRSFLDRQVELVEPRVIVALGRVAAQQLLRTRDSLGRLRGRWHEVAGVPVRVTYHPAFLLRDPSYKRAAWDDMKLVRDRLLEAPGDG